MDREVQRSANAASSEPQQPTVRIPARLTSKQLLGTRTELVIEHDGREYRLRLTQNGKLILTA